MRLYQQRQLFVKSQRFHDKSILSFKSGGFDYYHDAYDHYKRYAEEGTNQETAAAFETPRHHFNREAELSWIGGQSVWGNRRAETKAHQRKAVRLIVRRTSR